MITCRQIFYTVCICLNHFAFGMSSNVLWPALVDLHYIYSVSIENISFIVTFNSFGYLIGSLFGLFYPIINRQLTLALLMIILAISIALTPFYSYLWHFFIMNLLGSIGSGAWDSSNNVWLVEMWKDRNAPVIQTSQFMYGLGTIVAPIIVGPYVHGENNKTANEIWPVDERMISLALPFGLVSIVQLFIPTIFFITFFILPYGADQADQVVDGEEAIASLPSHPRLELDVDPIEPIVTNRRLKLFFMSIFLATYNAAEISYFFYAPTTFQYMQIKMEANQTAFMSSILSGSYTIGRLLCAFISMKLKPDIIITNHFIIIIISLVFIFVERDNQLFIFLGTSLLGLGFSAMWPAILTFADKHLRLTDKAGSALFFAAGVVSMFTPLIISPLLKVYPLILFYFELIYLSLSVSLFIGIKFCLLPKY